MTSIDILPLFLLHIFGILNDNILARNVQLFTYITYFLFYFTYIKTNIKNIDESS